MDDDITENATKYVLGVETDKMKKMKQAYPMKIISIGDHYVGTFWAEKFAVSIQMWQTWTPTTTRDHADGEPKHCQTESHK